MTDDMADPLQWLVDLQAQAKRADRPRGKANGRWLGDFLNQTAPYGLLPVELELLEACAKGETCGAAIKPPKPVVELDDAAGQTLAQKHAALVHAEAQRRAALHSAVENNIMRAEFLRFLALGGDEFAPVHERGIQLQNALIEGTLDLRSGRCVARIALTGCELRGKLLLQDARLDVLVLSSSWLRGLRANRAKISGAIWLNDNFTSDSCVSLLGIEVGGRLECSGSYFGGGIDAAGASLGGDLNLTSVTAERTISFANATIGGSLICKKASFKSYRSSRAGAPKAALNISRVNIKGNADFAGAYATAAETEANDHEAIEAQNISADGSVRFGDGFMAKGEVSFNGAEIAKDLDFSNSFFYNGTGFAIRVDRAKIAGVLRFETTAPAPGSEYFFYFRSHGCVTLDGVECAQLSCLGGRFVNPGADALYCSSINVKGSVFLKNAEFPGSAKPPFLAFGAVNFYAAQIGQNLECIGCNFKNPGGAALYCQAAKIALNVFLGAEAIGKVDFTGANIGLQFNCQSGKFRNDIPDSLDSGIAAAALGLSAARIGDTLFLGRDTSDTEPPVIGGSVDLRAATVRLLVDEGLVQGNMPGLRETAAWRDNEGNVKQLRCNLNLDQFVYERLQGNDACDAKMRLKWLERQPPEDLQTSFKPQPFEQLIAVLRAAGHDDAADEIAISKRKRQRQASMAQSRDAGLKDVLTIPFKFITGIFEVVFIDWFTGYGYKMGRAVVLLLVLFAGFALFYNHAFQHGAIVPADKDIRNNKDGQPICQVWSRTACPNFKPQAIPLFNPWLYSLDVMVPVVSFGQKSAWVPEADAPWTYYVQLFETVLGWIEGILLLSFVTGLIAKE